MFENKNPYFSRLCRSENTTLPIGAQKILRVETVWAKRRGFLSRGICLCAASRILLASKRRCCAPKVLLYYPLVWPSYYSAELEVYIFCQQRNALRPEETIVPYSKSVLISASFLQNKLPVSGELFRIPFLTATPSL